MGDVNPQDVARSWWQYFDYCFNLHPSAMVCEAFWSKWILALIGFGALGVAYGIWKFVDYRRKVNAAHIAEWMREQVDEVGIRETKWNADKAYQAELPDAEVLAKIQAAVEERRQQNRRPVGT